MLSCPSKPSNLQLWSSDNFNNYKAVNIPADRCELEYHCIIKTFETLPPGWRQLANWKTKENSSFHMPSTCLNFNKISPLKILIYSMDETFWNQLNSCYLYCWARFHELLGLLHICCGTGVKGLILSTSVLYTHSKDSYLYNCFSRKGTSWNMAMIIASKYILHSRDWVGWGEQW